MTRYEDVKDRLFEQNIDLFLIEWYERWAADGGDLIGFNREILRRASRAVQIYKGAKSTDLMGMPLSQVSRGQIANSDGGHRCVSPRSDNERDHSIAAERPGDGFPAQHKQTVLGGHEHVADGRQQVSTQSQNERGYLNNSEGTITLCPAQQESGFGQETDADTGQTIPSKSVPQRDPTQSQVNAQLAAKTKLSRSLFETVFCGQAIGSHSWRSLAAIRDDGALAQAFIDEIGEIGEDDKDRSVRELLGGSEARIRRVMESCKRIPSKKAA